MSSPTTTQPMNGSGGDGRAEIAGFVDAVRSQLDDLSADEVTELTGGLEADLTDAFAEEGASPAQRYGDPAEYARELRSAAGLPPRAAGGVRRATAPRGSRLVSQLTRDYVNIRRELEEASWWPAVRDFLVVLRPAWWLIRAWVAVQIGVQILVSGGSHELIRGGFGGLLVLLAAIVVSVQLGRRSPWPQHWQRVLLVIGNLLAAVLLLPIASTTGGNPDYGGSSYSSSAPDGLNLGGTSVTNVFPYDAQGRPLTGVQLYDQDGQSLDIGSDSRDDGTTNDTTGITTQPVPASGPGVPERWNVFPLEQKPQEDDGSLGAAEPAPLPFAVVPPLVAAPAASSTASPTASPGASSSATPTPTGAASSSTKPSPSPSSSTQVTPRPSATK